MAEISKIKVASGTYDIKDKTAREKIGTKRNLCEFSEHSSNGKWDIAIQKAYEVCNHLVIDFDVTVENEIQLPNYKTLEIGACTVTKDGANNDSVVNVGNYSTLFGISQANSRLSSTNFTPYGVVRFGAKSFDGEHGNVLYSTVKGLSLQGVGSSSLNIGVNICNPQTNGLAVYFNTITDLRIDGFTHGVMIEGWANANKFANIEFINVGNNYTGGAFYFKGQGAKTPMENIISNAFHHDSSNSYCIVFDSTESINYNIINGIACEQGGNSYGVFVVGDTPMWNNKIQISVNSSLGNRLGNNAHSNVIQIDNYLHIRKMMSSEADIVNLSANTLASNIVNVGTKVIQGFSCADKISENSNVPILKITPISNGTSVIVIDICTMGQSPVGPWNRSDRVILCATSTNGTLFLETIQGGERYITVDGDTVFFQTGNNNGTTNKFIYCNGVVEVTGGHRFEVMA